MKSVASFFYSSFYHVYWQLIIIHTIKMIITVEIMIMEITIIITIMIITMVEVIIMEMIIMAKYKQLENLLPTEMLINAYHIIKLHIFIKVANIRRNLQIMIQRVKYIVMVNRISKRNSMSKVNCIVKGSIMVGNSIILSAVVVILVVITMQKDKYQ
uniref:Hypotheticial protein n=1 Tax=Schistosoma japonicum TaxID=6182 RepID=C1LC50_SCHJA|nr:hypotheticial protein [Schistosoma japonicum]